MPTPNGAYSDVSDHRYFQSRELDRLGTPKAPAIRFTRAMTFGATWFTHLLRRARLLAPSTDLTTFAANGGFYFQAFNG